jgi:Flp pilus assembly pilin Flp
MRYRTRCGCEAGGASIEYAIVATLISVAIFSASQLLGYSIQAFFQSAADTAAEAAPE